MKRLHRAAFTARHSMIAILLLCTSLFAQNSADNPLRKQLAEAIAEADVEGIKKALKAGAPTAEVANGKSAWYLALTANSYRDAVLALFKPEPGDIERAGQALLGFSADPSPEGVESLAKLGVDLNVRDESGKTPLMIAAELGSIHKVRVLLAYGADSTLKNQDGQTALDLVKKAIKGQEWRRGIESSSEANFRATQKLLEKYKLGPLAGKVFATEGKFIEISGGEIKRLKKGSKIVVKSSTEMISGVVQEVMHTKVKATLNQVGAAKGDSVYLKRD